MSERTELLLQIALVLAIVGASLILILWQPAYESGQINMTIHLKENPKKAWALYQESIEFTNDKLYDKVQP